MKDEIIWIQRWKPHKFLNVKSRRFMCKKFSWHFIRQLFRLIPQSTAIYRHLKSLLVFTQPALWFMITISLNVKKLFSRQNSNWVVNSMRRQRLLSKQFHFPRTTQVERWTIYKTWQFLADASSCLKCSLSCWHECLFTKLANFH